MSLRNKPFVAVGGALLGACALIAPATVASAAGPPLPTLHIALKGTTGVTVSGSTISGAVNILSTFSGKAPTGPNSNGPTLGLVRLRAGETIQDAFSAVGGNGDLNKLTPYGSLMVDASAPSLVQTVLAPGNYAALNITGNGLPGYAEFTVTQAPSPALLPPARATERSIEFGFRGPTVLHRGEVVRAENSGFLVHMIVLFGVKDAVTGRKVIALLRSGRDQQAEQLATNTFVNLLGPASPGALQQQVLRANFGYYVEACFMDTQDGREHTQLGMERLVQVVP
jgi:hypothetical protein